MQGACFWCGNGVSRTGGVHGISDNIADEDELPSIARCENVFGKVLGGEGMFRPERIQQ